MRERLWMWAVGSSKAFGTRALLGVHTWWGAGLHPGGGWTRTALGNVFIHDLGEGIEGTLVCG